jgi:hypothetical protein
MEKVPESKKDLDNFIINLERLQIRYANPWDNVTNSCLLRLGVSSGDNDL